MGASATRRSRSVLRALFVGGRRGGSCCGGRFSMPSHSVSQPMVHAPVRKATRHGAVATGRPLQQNCTADSPKVQGVAPKTHHNFMIPRSTNPRVHDSNRRIRSFKVEMRQLAAAQWRRLNRVRSPRAISRNPWRRHSRSPRR